MNQKVVFVICYDEEKTADDGFHWASSPLAFKYVNFLFCKSLWEVNKLNWTEKRRVISYNQDH